MTAFSSMLKMNLKRRFCDGFAVGYNLIFPAVMIGLLGTLCKKLSYGGISGYQYYTVVMIPFCTIMALITAAYAGKDDAYAKTAERVLLTPISTKAIVWSKVISCSLVFFLCGILVYGAAGILTGLEMRSIGWISILFLTLSFSVSSIGTLIGLGMKNFLVLKNVLNIPIAIFAILGGTFFRIGTFNRVGNFVLNLSPIRWINRSMFQLLFEGNQMLLLYTAGVLIIVGSVCAVLAIKTFQKGEYMNGSMPGYEK